jgi:PKD repeat protein
MQTRSLHLLQALSLALVLCGSVLLTATQAAPDPLDPIHPWSAQSNGAERTPGDGKGSSAASISVMYSFSAPRTDRVDEYDRVTIPGLPRHGEPGAPVLPFRMARILLPDGAAFQDVDIIAGDGAALEGVYHLEPGQPFVPTHLGSSQAPTPPDPAIYGSAFQYPGQLYSMVGVQKLTGYTILFLKLYPVQVVPKTGRLIYYERLTVHVRATSPAPTATSPPTKLRSVAGDAERVRHMVDNPEILTSYAAPPTTSRATSPESSLVDVDHPYDYIIITSDVLSSTFHTLASWKASRGLEARVFSTEDITANYSGDDEPERIRNFIVDAYTTWAATDHPLQYVVLGGDTEVIPIRSIFVRSGSYSTWMPVDLYYGGLDGDWDSDGDGNYGEPSGDGTEGEECDFFAEVYVGRMPVETVAEAQHIVNKTIAYEQNPSAGYLDRALWLGRKLDDYTWGGDSKDLVSDLVPQYNVTALYDRDSTYSTSGVISNMNDGTHLVNFDGHGSSSCCPLTPEQVDELTNDAYFLFYNLGCNTAQFDKSSGEAVAEHYVFNAHGAFAYIGNTRYGWYSPGSTNGPGNQLDRRFFDFAVNTDDHHIGRALQLAKEDYYPGHRWSILTLSLFGDPETSLVTELPVPVANISGPKGGTIVRHRVDVAGTATAGGTPGATFGHFALAYGSGKDPSSWTQIGVSSTVAVTDDILGTWDTTVLPDAIYTLRLVVDDGTGQTSSDRIIVETDNFYITTPEGGELVRGGDVLTITGSALGTDFTNYVVEYGQGSNPSSWTLVVSSTTPVTDGLLVAWDTSSIGEAGEYTIRLTRHGTAHTDSERVTITIDPSWQVGWPQEINYRLVAPSIAIGDLDGDGDQELVTTESQYDTSSAMVRVFQHNGTAAAGWPQWRSGGRLSAPALADMDRDGDLEIIVGSYDDQVYAWHHDGRLVAGWPKPTGGDVHASPAVADLDGDGRMEVVVGSFDGQLYVWEYDGTIEPGWPQTAGDALYGSAALGDIDGDGDSEVLAARKGLIAAWHHDGGLVAGWPVTLTTAPSNLIASPALGDIVGDDHPEVVLAVGDQVYAWYHDGVTVTGWPKTVTGTIESSPGLGDLDGDGDLEVIVGSDRVNAWHGDGAIVAGWPVTLSQHTSSSPVVGDITGDGEAEVVIGGGDEDELFYAWHHDGTLVSGWPRWVPAFEGTGDHFERLASPILTDLDLDGDVEVAIGAESYVIIHDLAATYSTTHIEWPMFHHDLWLTGWYTSSSPNSPPLVWDARANPWYVMPSGLVTITVRATDEDGVASVTAQIESPDETVLDTLVLYDDGAHHDGAVGDGVYGNGWTTLSTKQDYLVDITAADTLSKAYTHDNVADFTTQDVPFVQYDSHTINAENINADGVPNPGEYVECSLRLENQGVLTAPGVTATLSTDDEHIWWYNASPIVFGDIFSGSTAASGSHEFFFQVSSFCPHGHTVTFDLDIYDTSGHHWNDEVEVTIVDSVGPTIRSASAEPRHVVAGDWVTITAYVEDSSAVDSVQAIIESPDETSVLTLTLYDDGAHGDGRTGDRTYGNAWATDDVPRTYQVDFSARDELGNVSSYDNLTAFTSQAFTQTSSVLLFADDGGYRSTDEFRHYYTDALADVGASFDVWDSYFYGLVPSATLQLYADGVVIWAVPNWGYTSYAELQENLRTFLDSGGKLFVSGQNVGQAMGYTELYNDYLHANYIHYGSDSLTLAGVPGDPIGDGLLLSITGGDGANNQTSADEITPSPPATSVFTYTGSTSGNPGGIRVDSGTYRAVYFAFGFEAINTAGDRATVMARVLSWLLAPPSPKVGFSVPAAGWVGQGIGFTNTTVVTGPVNYRWAFGDGTTSTLTSPTHVYNLPGEYTVALTATNLAGSDTATDTVTVYSKPAVDFAAAPLTGTYPLTVTFTSTATTTPLGDPTLAYLWQFGDGGSTRLPHPTYVYTKLGIYTVTLQVNNAAGGATLTRTSCITAYEPVKAGFTASPTVGVAPLTVHFTDTSTGSVAAWEWAFGDGASSALRHPSHTYTVAGVYTVSLTVRQAGGAALWPGGTDVLTRQHFVTVQVAYNVYLPCLLHN